MKTGLTIRKKPCADCVRSSHGAHCAWGITGKCKLLPGKIKPLMYEIKCESKKHITHTICTTIIRGVMCDCGRYFTTNDWKPWAILTCPDCGFSDKVTDNSRVMRPGF